MSTPPVSSRVHVQLPALLRRPRVARPGHHAPDLFDPRLRRWAVGWVCVSLPVIVVAGGVAATTPDRYLVVLGFVASWVYTTPALVFTTLAVRRAPGADERARWLQLWLASVALVYAIGCGMLLGAVTQLRVPAAVVAVAVGTTGVLLMATVVWVVHGRSGRRALSVDLLESVMSIIVVAAPTAIIWGDDVLAARAPWFAAVCAFASVAMVFGVYWSVLLFLRLRRDRSGEGAGAIGFIAVLLASVALVNAVAQTAQGVTGYALPAAPLLALHGLCMSLLMLVPLYVPDAISPGLDSLPPQDQVRGAWLPAVLILVGLPHLLAVAVVERADQPRATLFSLLALALVLVLAALRQLAASRETQRLYAEVEHAAEARRDLLAALMQRIDDDRHRVAAQLHEQAVSAYASFVTVAQMSAIGGDQRSLAGASAMVRDDLRAQAEALRQLMVAVRPLEVDRPRATNLSTPIRAFVDALYRERRGPSPQVRVADDVELDWTTETLVLRIVQEAVRNVWRHARAASLDVSVRADGAVVEVAIADDGVGFRPDGLMFESGIAAMRSFAELGQGHLAIDSAPGGGTTVTARLGEGAGHRARFAGVPPTGGMPATDARPAPRLRLVDAPTGTS